MHIHLKLDKELLAEQKQILLEQIWHIIDEEDERFKLWGLIDMIDHIQDYWEEG